VLFACISGVWAYRKVWYLSKGLILDMVSRVFVGGLRGRFFSNYLPAVGFNTVYAALATFAFVMMYLLKSNDDAHAAMSQIAFTVEVAAVIVVAAGAFILVPIMIVVLKIPTRMTIASSLAITFISSIGTAVGKIATGQVLLLPAIILVIASIIGAPLAARAGKTMNTKYLQWILAGLILASAIKIWFELF